MGETRGVPRSPAYTHSHVISGASGQRDSPAKHALVAVHQTNGSRPRSRWRSVHGPRPAELRLLWSAVPAGLNAAPPAATAQPDPHLANAPNSNRVGSEKFSTARAAKNVDAITPLPRASPVKASDTGPLRCYSTAGQPTTECPSDPADFTTTCRPSVASQNAT